MFYCKLCCCNVSFITTLCPNCYLISEIVQEFGNEFILERLNKNKEKMKHMKNTKLIIKHIDSNNNKTPLID